MKKYASEAINSRYKRNQGDSMTQNETEIKNNKIVLESSSLKEYEVYKNTSSKTRQIYANMTNSWLQQVIELNL